MLYFRVGGLIALILLMFGCVYPFLINSPHAGPAWGSLALLLFVGGPLMYLSIKGIIKDSKRILKNVK